jgi:hypothetical protein
MKKCYVFFEVGTEFSYIIYTSLLRLALPTNLFQAYYSLCNKITQQ